MKLRIAVMACLLALASPVQAQDKYPSKPIRIVLPYGAGSATDIIDRKSVV